MALRFSAKDKMTLGLFVAAGVLLAVISYTYMMNAIEGLVRKDAQQTAYAWSEYFSKNLRDINDIAQGKAPSKISLSFIEQARSAGNVFRFKLFDKSGRIRLISDDLSNMRVSNQVLIKHNPTAQKVVSTGTPFTQVKEGKPPDRPLLYAETYLPVFKDGQLSAILEVYVDQTGKRQFFRNHFLSTIAGIVLIIFLALVIPASLFFWRSRQKQHAEQQIEFLSSHDVLTGGMNRSRFKVELDEAVDNHWDAYKFVAVHSVDIDHFKEVNDTYGSDTGDRMILEVSDRLRQLCGKHDFISRFGGDEFVIAQCSLTYHSEIERFADKIVDVMQQPFIIQDKVITASASVGTAIAPTDGQSADDLLRHADLALRSAKADGRQRRKRFTPEMNIELAARRKIEAAVRHATFNKSFRLKFQPVYDARNDKLLLFETLIRLPLSEGEEISPAVFIPIAEDMGLIKTIGTWVIEAACGMASHWPDHIRVAINLSTLQFKDGDIVDIVRHALEKSGLAAERLEVEITEGLLLKDTEETLEQLAGLKELGVSIAMDDFGTGYSSLSYLWQFPFDKIKIDQSFVKALNTPEDEIVSILQTIVSLGHSLKMSVTAEGVESPEQVSILKEMCCDQFQGYYFGHPVTEQDAASIILNMFVEDIALRNAKIEKDSLQEFSSSNQ